MRAGRLWSVCFHEDVRIRFLLHDAFGEGGGVVTVTFSLAEELAKRHDVELVSLIGHPMEPIHPLPAGVRVRSLTTPRDSHRWWNPLRALSERWRSRLMPEFEVRSDAYSLHTDLVLWRYLRSVREGVLVTMQPGLTIASARLGRDSVVRVGQDHRPFARRPPEVLDAYQRYAGNLDLLLTLTRADARRFRELMSGRVKVRALANGAPPYDGPRSTGESRVVVAAGRLTRPKGFDILIDAWSQVAQIHPDWRLDIYGEGHGREDLTRQIADLGLTEQVRLRGFTTQLQAELAAASIFVLSSRAEGYPRVILEAMACALPVVSTDCPSGPREMIESGTDGVLVPTNDPAALAVALVELIELGPEGRRRLGEAGLARAHSQSQPEIARRWEELLESLLSQKFGNTPQPVAQGT